MKRPRIQRRASLLQPPRPSPLLLAMPLCLCLVEALVAQQPASSNDAPRHEWVVAPFLGYAQNSPVGKPWGATPDRDHLFAGIHFATPVLRIGPVTMSYAPNAVPLLRLTNNPTYGWVTFDDRPPIRVEVGRSAVYGAGIAPLGLRWDVRLHPRFAIFGGGAVGGIWFTRAVPVDRARAFNYTAEWGGGLEVTVRGRTRIQAGYKLHHLSNMGSEPVNPGVDAHLFYAGVPFVVRLPR